MGFGGSILLITLGAILRWAITFRMEGVDLHVVGTVLMIAGAVGLLISLVLHAAPSGRRRVTP